MSVRHRLLVCDRYGWPVVSLRGRSRAHYWIRCLLHGRQLRMWYIRDDGACCRNREALL